MKRFFGRSRSDNTAKSLIRAALVEAFRASACVLCVLARQHNPRYVETLLHEAVMDVAQRDTWRAARGLCSWHAWMALEVPQSASNVAILYDDVLQHDLTHLAPVLHTGSAPGRWPWPRRFGGRFYAWLHAWRRCQPCQACALWLQQERLYSDVLLDDWQETTIRLGFDASNGLCWPHFLGIVNRYHAHPHVAALVAVQQTCLARLQRELREFLRKQDYRFAHEPYGREADAWQRVVALYAGGRGRFGECFCAALKRDCSEM